MNTNTDEKKFIDKYGYDALKIIAAFEEAFEIDDEKRYTTWFGDYNMYETSTDDLSEIVQTFLCRSTVSRMR